MIKYITNTLTNTPNTMRRVWVSVEPRGFWAVQRNMEPLSSAGTLSRMSSLPSCSSRPSSRRPLTFVHVNMGSGKTSLCGYTYTHTHKGVIELRAVGPSHNGPHSQTVRTHKSALKLCIRSFNAQIRDSSIFSYPNLFLLCEQI